MARGTLAFAPVIAKSSDARNAWLTTQFARTGLSPKTPCNQGINRENPRNSGMDGDFRRV
jgi:hypothetical protein